LQARSNDPECPDHCERAESREAGRQAGERPDGHAEHGATGGKYQGVVYSAGSLGPEVLVMSKNTSVTLGDHFQTFVDDRVQTGRYASASEVVRAGLRLLEEHETRVDALRKALQEGEDSGLADYSLQGLIEELDAENAR
jgi:antitoxin ParD1/3/4